MTLATSIQTPILLGDRGAESDQRRGAESDTLSPEIGGPRVTDRGAESDTPRSKRSTRITRTKGEEPDRVSAEGDLARDPATATRTRSTR